jgi:hypothetical protein
MHVRGQVLGPDQGFVAVDEGVLEGALQFPDVPRSGVVHQDFDSVVADALDGMRFF